MKKLLLNFLKAVMFLFFIISFLALIFLFFTFINVISGEFNTEIKEANVIVLLPTLICLISFSFGMGIKHILKYFNY
jgi:hypothetical protein